MTGSFPLELPPFTAVFLNGDISSLHHAIEEKKEHNSRDIISSGLVSKNMDDEENPKN